MNDADAWDVIIVGAGAGGMAAAVTAKLLGLRVLVVEKESVVGGTTARSGGGLWIPCNPLAKAAGIEDTIEQAQRYLRNEAGPRFDADRVDAYLVNAPRMVDFFQQKSAVRFVLQHALPDYHLDVPGSAARGRTIYAAPFDARELGRFRLTVAPPLDVLTFLGMAIARTDLEHFFNGTRSLKSAAYVGGRLLLQLHDLMRYGRSVRLVNGNALAARLLKSALDLQIPVRLESSARSLHIEDGRVCGVAVEAQGKTTTLVARRGVVLAAGGFAHGVERQKHLFPHVRRGVAHRSPSARGSTGDGLRLGESAGGQVTDDCANAGYWAPVSIVPRRNGRADVFPHTNGAERSKPGVIAVTRSGRRFVNEATTYHEFVQALLHDAARGDDICAFLIADHRAVRRYGLGLLRPFPFPVTPYLHSGYVVRAPTLEQLGKRLGIDAPALADTVMRFNMHAREGRDPEFSKGTNAYHWYQGDPRHRPNPCVGPLDHPPFYGLKLLIGDVGTLAGLRTDAFARVLDRDGRPVVGLYAVGNDMANLVGGNTPGAGITLGPAMTFGFIAARHMARAEPDVTARAHGGRRRCARSTAPAAPRRP